VDIHNSKIAVMGLGYVGLPLMVEFAKHFLLLVLISIQFVSTN
jgi:UDP-N-acetyl-D-mannosaminuronate dehydrogenase